jgi:hypothetical protein
MNLQNLVVYPPKVLITRRALDVQSETPAGRGFYVGLARPLAVKPEKNTCAANFAPGRLNRDPLTSSPGTRIKGKVSL